MQKAKDEREVMSKLLLYQGARLEYVEHFLKVVIKENNLL